MTRRILALCLPLALAACQDITPPEALPDAAFLAAGNTVDVIVVLNDQFATVGHSANQNRAGEIARSLGVTPRFTYGTALFGFTASIPTARLNGLRKDPRVAYVDFDAPVSIPDVVACRPGKCGGGSTGQVVPWGIGRIGAAGTTNTGEGIRVYIIDTGIDLNHADLKGNLSIGIGFASEPCKGTSCVHPWHDDHDHGTHVAGTVGAIANGQDVVGVAPKVIMHAVKVLSKAGSGSRAGVIAGVDWVATQTSGHGATVANMSLSGSGSKSGTCTDSAFTGEDSYHEAICNAKNAGVVFVVAAGNDGANAATRVPAAYYDAVITVSATTCSRTNEVCTAGTDTWTSWSNWGNASHDLWPSAGSLPVIIAAPGQGVISTKRGGGTVAMSGTSMASPHGAGVAAQILKSNPSWTAGSTFDNVRKAMIERAEPTTDWANTTGNVHTERFLKAF
jgi:subtilisin